MADLSQHKITFTAFDASTDQLVVVFQIDGANDQKLVVPPEQATDIDSVVAFIKKYVSDWLDGQAAVEEKKSKLDLTPLVGTNL